MPQFDKNIFEISMWVSDGFQYPAMSSVMLEKWKRSAINIEMFGAFLTDLWKAFDCDDRELLIAKRNAYSFSLKAGFHCDLT